MIKYSENGLWIKQEENRYTVGISPKGQDDIGDVSFVELFVQESLTTEDSFMSVEAAKAVTELFAPGHEVHTIGIRHGEKMYETLLTNEECANAIDLGDFYRVPCDKRDLNYDKYFKDGDIKRNLLTEFNSNNTDLLTVEEVKNKLLSLKVIQDELSSFLEEK